MMAKPPHNIAKRPARAASPLHPANPFRSGYPMAGLVQVYPALAPFVIQTAYGESSIDFADPQAVLALNSALLAMQYQLTHWHLPAGYLCPAVPGRLDYLLYLADLLASTAQGKTPKARAVRLLDIGCGANLIYSLLAVKAMGWRVLSAELDLVALEHAQKLINLHQLSAKIELRPQLKASQIFHGVLQQDDYVDVTLCNPPFHASAEAAAAGSDRKRRNLGLTADAAALNFAGQAHELYCPGGEAAFLAQMATESKDFASQVCWFSSLVSKQQHLAALQQQLQKLGAVEIKIVEMAQGQKQSRFIAWTFLTAAQQQLWRQHRWR